MEEGSGEQQKEKTGTRMRWEPVHPLSGPHNRKSCFRNPATAVSARSAVPGWPFPSQLRSEATGTITGPDGGHVLLFSGSCLTIVPVASHSH